MRRMYSEQELTKIIKEVSEAYISELIEEGEFDDDIASYVDAYLVEHPVDITALEGQDIEVKSINITDGLNYSQLVDSDGHSRFLESPITNNVPLKITASYAKYSLSGTHLMVVCAGQIAANAEFSDDEVLFSVDLPSWISNKVVPVISGYIEWKSFECRTTGYAKVTTDTHLYKTGVSLRIRKSGAQTFTADTLFRFNFDLIID